MRAGWVGNTALRERLQRANPTARPIVEAVIATREDIKDTKAEWDSPDDATGLAFPEIGGVRLARDTDAVLVENAVADADEGDLVTDLDNQVPFHVLEIEWTGSEAREREIHQLTARINPDVDNSGREVDRMVAQLFRVTQEGEVSTGVVEAQIISGRATADISGNSETTVTFDFLGTEGAPPKPGQTPFFGPGADSSREVNRPKTWVKVWAVTSDGSPAGNVAWVGDAAQSEPLSTTDADVRLIEVTQVDSAEQASLGGQFTLTGGGVSGLPEFSVGGKTYTEDIAAYTGSSNQIDLGAVPASGTDLVVFAQGEEPGGSSLTWELSDDGGTSWTTVVDGDVIGDDNSLSRQQTYAARVTLTPNGTGSATPFARRFGIEEVTRTDLDGVADVVDAGKWGFDPVTLKGEIPQATIRLLKDGIRDYRSEGERIFADNHIGDIEFYIWIGHPDLARQHWLLVDAFEVDDYNSEGAAIKVVGLSPLRRLKTGVPPFDASADERKSVSYSNTTLKAAWDDLLDSQIGLPGRYRGPGVEDTSSQTVAKTISKSDGKTELDAIAHLAGGTNITSQGRIKFQRAFVEGGIRAEFPMEEVRVRGVTPGYENRLDEYFVPYNFDEASDDFQGEVRSFHAPSITKLGSGSLDAPEELDEETARWIPTPNDKTVATAADNLAAHVADRTTDEIGPGLKQIRFTSTVPRPGLEPGDTVAVETDQLVLKSPDTDEAFRGVLGLIGVIQTQEDVLGTQFTVWVQKIADAIPSAEDVQRLGYEGIALRNFRVTNRDESSLTYEWVRTVDTAQVWVYDIVVPQPISSDNWPGADSQAEAVLDTANSYTATVPDSGSVRLLQFEARNDVGEPGTVWRAEIRPTTSQVSTWKATENRANSEATITGNLLAIGTYTMRVYRVDPDGTETQVAETTGQTAGAGNEISHTASLNENTNLMLYGEVEDDRNGEVVETTDIFTLDPDEIADTTLSVSVRPDGNGVAKGLADKDAEGGVIHLTTAVGAAPEATNPDGTENTVDLSAGQRQWSHTLTGVDVGADQDLSVKARAETSGGNLAPTSHIEEAGATQQATAGLSSVAAAVGDDGTDDNYSSEWEPNALVDDSVHDLLVDYYDGATKVVTNTVTDPSTTTTNSHTEGGAGGDHPQTHKVRFRLQEQATGTTVFNENTTIQSQDTSGGDPLTQEPT